MPVASPPRAVRRGAAARSMPAARDLSAVDPAGPVGNTLT